jgi:hypothetical protein
MSGGSSGIGSGGVGNGLGSLDGSGNGSVTGYGSVGVTGGSAIGGPSGSVFGGVGVCCEFVMLINSFYTQGSNSVCIVKYITR